MSTVVSNVVKSPRGVKIAVRRAANKLNVDVGTVEVVNNTVAYKVPTDTVAAETLANVAAKNGYTVVPVVV